MKRKTVLTSVVMLMIVGATLLFGGRGSAASDLITYWKFDEATAGSTAVDSSDSGFDGTPHGVSNGSNDPALEPQPSTDVPPTNFPDSHSAFFQGDGGNNTGSYYDVSNWNVDTSNGFTVSLWAKPETTPGSSWERFFDFGNGPGSDNIVFAQNGGSDQVYFEVYNGGSTTKIIAPGGSWGVGQWHYYAATIDADGNATIYIDGQAVVSGTTNKPVNIARTNKYIGKSNWGDDYYEGYMDDLRVYGRALTQTEVQDLTAGNSGPGVPDNNGLPAGVEDAAPNGGDANNDGTADSQQPNVASYVNPQTSHYVSVATPNVCTLSALSSNAETANAVADGSYTYPAGLVNYTAACGTPGYTATVNLYFYGVSESNLVLRKYNPTTKTYATISNAVITPTTIAGQAVMEVSYQVTDGGPLDTDGAADGTIIDPVGLAYAPTAGGTLVNTGLPLAMIGAMAACILGAALYVRTRVERRFV